MTPEPTPSQELEKLYQSDHSIGSHSDDRGGSADFPCYCQVKKRIEAYIKQHELSRKQEWARENEPKIEIKAKLEALDKLVLGAGEYHDDPYEYVVRLRDIQRYRQALNKFDLTQPVFKDKTIKEQSKE